MDNLGGSYRFWGVWRSIQGKVSLLGDSAKTHSWQRLRLRGIAFGGVLSLLGLFARFLHLTAFLLFVPNTRVLTIADIGIMENRMEATVHQQCLCPQHDLQEPMTLADEEDDDRKIGLLPSEKKKSLLSKPQSPKPAKS